MKKIIVCILILILIVIVVGCSPGENQKNTQCSTTSIDTESIHIKIFRHFDYGGTKRTNEAVEKWINNTSNIEIIELKLISNGGTKETWISVVYKYKKFD